jgi:disulfide bond formation protein DsbB
MLAIILAAGILFVDAALILAAIAYLLNRVTNSEVLSRHIKSVEGLLSEYYRELGLVFSSVTVIGSLYISEALELAPCELCWYQRVLIFPLPILLTVSLVMKRRDVADYVLTLAALGIPISAYHYLVQMTLASTGCSTTVSCDSIQIQEFGFVTVPWMSLTFFISTVLLMLAAYQDDKNE